MIVEESEKVPPNGFLWISALLLRKKEDPHG